MVPNKRRRDPPNIGREVDKDCGQGTELYHRHCRRDLLRIAVVDVSPPAREDEVRGRTDRDELGQTLNYPENDRLK